MKQLIKDILKTISTSLIIMVGLYFLLIVYFLFFYFLNHIITSEEIKDIADSLYHFLNFPFGYYAPIGEMVKIFTLLTWLLTIFLAVKLKLKSKS